MNTALKILPLTLIAALFSACISFHSGNVSSGPLLNVNDQYKEIANGGAHSVNYLFVFGKKPRHLLLEAKKNLYQTRPLRNGEYYANFSSEVRKTIYFGLVFKTQVMVSADIMETADTTTRPFSTAFTKALNSEPAPVKIPASETKSVQNNGSVLMAGDSVYFSTNEKDYHLYVVTSLDKETAILKSVMSGVDNKLVSLDNKFYFKRLGNISDNTYTNGDSVMAEFVNEYNASVKENGIVLGYSADGFYLILSKSGFHVLPATRIRKD